MKTKRLWIAAAVAAGVYLLFRRKATAAATAPAVPGDVVSGSQSVTIDSNVLSPTFGQPIN